MSPLDRIGDVARQELALGSPRYMIGRALQALLPPYSFGRVRARFLGLAGSDIGRGVLLLGHLRIWGEGPFAGRLHVGDHCYFNVGLTMDLGDEIRIGRWVTTGPEVALLTTTHVIADRDHRCGLAAFGPVTIGDGAWLGARVTVLPGVRIGEGAVVAAGSVVVHDVDPDTLVAGTPARLVRKLRETETDRLPRGTRHR